MMASILGDSLHHTEMNALLAAHSAMSIEEQRSWMSNHMTANDPFGTRAPNLDDRLQMGREQMIRTNQRLSGQLIDPLANQTARGDSDPLTYDDLANMQRQLDNSRTFGGISTSRKPRLLDTPELGDQLRIWLEQNHPNEEAFLRMLSGKHNTNPLDTVIECIKLAMPRASDNDALLDINRELNQLEKEKHGL